MRGCEAAGVLGLFGRDGSERIEELRRGGLCPHHPVEWIKSTPLHQALATGLPTKGKKLRALQKRAAHWDACALRVDPNTECTCAEVRATHEANQQKENRDA
jgi:hypothetical protein